MRFCLHRNRCALTAPFHPYLLYAYAHSGRFVFCCTGRLPVLRRESRTLSGTLPCGVRTFLPRRTAHAADGSDRPAACSVSVPHSEKRSAMQLEVDRDDGGYVDRAAVDDVGPVAPLAYGVDGGSAQQMMTTENMDDAYSSILGDDSLEGDLAFDASETREPRILRLRRGEQVGGHDAGRDSKGPLVRASRGAAGRRRRPDGRCRRRGRD